MKLNKVIGLVILSIFTIASLSYAYTAMVNLAPEQDTPAGAARVEGAVADEQRPIDAANADDTRGRGDKGSPLHAWKDIAGKKVAGDTFTREEFAGEIRSKKPGGKKWSDTTMNLELQSLVNIGVLAPTGRQGEYKVLVTATLTQIDDINEEVIKSNKANGVERMGIVEGKRGAVGIDAHRLDALWLGKGDQEIGWNIINNIRKEIAKVTGVEVVPVSREDIQDPVEAMMAAGDLVPAVIFINEERPFTVAGKELESYQAVSEVRAELAQEGNVLDTRALLANLVDLGLFSDAVPVENETGNFEPTEVKTVLFKGEFVTRDPEAFNRAYQEQVAKDPNKIAVIISTNEDQMETAIKAALEKVELLSMWGNKIIVMGVQLNSPAAVAFANLFGDDSFSYDFDKGKQNILDNKNVVKGLAGAV